MLDLGLPDLDGVEVIAGLRGWTQVPIIVLSARTDSDDKVEALDAGADDYVTKPFGMDELLARLRAAVRRGDAARRRRGPGRRAPRPSPSTWPPSGSPRDGDEVRLTPTEWQLLEMLVRNPGGWSPQRQLLHEVWGPGYAHGDQLPARLPRPAAPQARSRPGPPAAPHHRARDGLPVRGRAAALSPRQDRVRISRQGVNAAAGDGWPRTG